ncbi:MAG: FAD-dependent oxidoreductase [Patescibacteria group bacterium]|nr:FAD-dependent oxidoreductase [Patescibacteria group bacterium]
MKKAAILGGGLTGLTTAYYLAKKNFLVTVFEKEKKLGGLAGGFKNKDWQWFLERTYHHLFANDKEIIDFINEIGFKGLFFKTPETASLYLNHKPKIYPLDTPWQLINFPLLSFFDRLRAGLVLAFLKISPPLSLYEKQTAINFLLKTMGEKSFNSLFEQLFRKKFGKYAENILASFIWARIKKRTKKLGYLTGGFQNFINYLEEKLGFLSVKILKNQPVIKIEKRGEKYLINNQLFNIVVSTLPSPLLSQISEKIFSAEFTQNLRKIEYLSAITLIIESKQPLLDKTYWLNVSTEKIPMMVIVQHTNFINKKHYGGKEIVYLGWYLEDSDPILKMTKEELIDFILPYLKAINPHYCSSITDCFLFKTHFAQPIFNKEFIKNKPNFFTPAKNFYLANLEMTYPYDRGTNYAVKLGKEVVKFIY